METWLVPGTMLVVGSHLGVGGGSQGSRMRGLKRGQERMCEPRRAEEDLYHTRMMGSCEVPARDYVDCGRRTGAERMGAEQLACADAASPRRAVWEGGGGALSRQTLEPHRMPAPQTPLTQRCSLQH